MSTYASVKQRIITELNRDDLEDELVDLLDTHFSRACEYYADRKFWFNSIVTTAVTVTNTNSVTIPSTVRVIDKLTIPAYNRQLKEVTLAKLSDYVTYSIPEYYSYYNSTLRFYPIPDAVYTLNIFGISQVDAPTTGASTNIWTTEAQDLTVSHTKATLCRDVFRDPVGFQLASGAETDALARLQRETAKRLETPLRGRERQRGYDINVE